MGNAAGNRLEGKAGNDTLRGGSPDRSGSTVRSIVADDTLDGGAGTDVLLGDGGNDTLLARDGVNDQAGAAMSCGDGIDTLVADLKDDDTRPLPADCENVDQSDRREGPNVVVRSRSLPVARGGPLAVRLSCPRTLRSRCEGTLAARVDAAGAGFGPRTRYSIRPGRSATVSAGLPGRQRAAARHRGARIGLRSLERGR